MGYYSDTRVSSQDSCLFILNFDIISLESKLMESTKPLRDQERHEIKSKRTDHILEQAYQLFLEKGVANVEMIHVATAAQISRATLYRYFPSKLALSFATLKYVATNQFVHKFRAERKTFTGNGYEKFAQFVAQLVGAYQQYPEFFRFSAMIEHYYGQQLDPQEHAEWYRELYPGLFLEDTPQQFLEEGQLDGSIRQDIDSNIYLATVLATLPSLAEHLALNPELTKQTYNIDSLDRLLETAANALLLALRP